MNYSSRIAAFLSLAAVFLTYWVSENVYERLAHVEDEMAYVWQAQLLTRGEIAIPSPPYPENFYVPFVVDYHGMRFSKYPPGWPLILALGMLAGISAWVNPILSGLSVWLTYRLGQKIFDNRTALLSAFLMVTSPFFLLVSGSLLSHSWGLYLSLALALAWLDLFIESSKSTVPAGHSSHVVPTWIKVAVAGFSLGVLALTRPMTAVGVGLPFFVHGILLLRLGNWTVRRRVLSIGLIAMAISSFLPVWQFVLTGDPLINLYSLWYPYDKLGFGEGIGIAAGGHNLRWSFNNLVLSLMAGSRDLFGWAGLSWLFIPAGLWAARRNQSTTLIIGVVFSLVLVYTLYWISPIRYGPRYYYEGIFSLCLLTAAGIFWIADWSARPRTPRTLRTGVYLLVTFLIGYNLLAFLPGRFDSMRNVHEIRRAQQAPFLAENIQELTPALVLVHTEKWTDYVGLLPLEDPWLRTPFIFAYLPDSSTDKIDPNDFPDRRIIHYYPENMEVTISPK